MAKINGIEIKALKNFKGHDECAYFQGNIYKDGKKLGFWTQDAWAGPDRYSFDVKILAEACRNYKEGFPDGYEYKDYCDSPDVFVGAILKLRFAEKDCKEEFKKGRKAVFYMDDGFHLAYIGLPKVMDVAEVRKTFPTQVKSMENEMFKSGFRECVFTPDGFDLIVDKEHPAPDYLK